MRSSSAHLRRPLAVTFFALCVLLFAIWNAWLALRAVQQYDFMQSLGLAAPAVLLVVTGATWAIGFGLAAWGLWRLKSWGRYWMLLAIVVYQIQMWIERLALARTSYEELTRPAGLFISLLSIVVVWGFLFWPQIRRQYREQ